jgi:tRNA dimethylallyltransferase
MNVKTVFIVGPTASGKSALAIELAKKMDGEIICADSQTLRRGMDIGTAKPSITDRAEVPHHLLDCIDPYEPYNLSLFIGQAREVLKDIHARQKLAIIVGGTGLYTDALYFNFKLPTLRESKIPHMNIDELQAMIKSKGFKIPENSLNMRHLINVVKRAGSIGEKGDAMEDALIVGINPGREVLVKRINSRVDLMFKNGFINEVKELIKQYGKPTRAFDAIGYKIAYRFLNEEITIEEAIELFKIADRQYAKRQMSWYARNKDIVWFSSPDDAKTFILESV